MSHVYSDLPATSFWRRSVAVTDDIDPVLSVDFTIGPEDSVATAGSCFAQHIARRLAAAGYNYLVTEPAPEGAAEPESYGVFTARFGNIYTTTQLRQLLLRAYGLFTPKDQVWTLPDGGFVDPFRPRVETFPTVEALEADRAAHLGRVRQMLETCDVLVFTLGLTESWRSRIDGATVPLAPGVHGGDDVLADYEFHNLSVEEMLADLRDFLRRLKTVNPGVKVILTVSPVPLIATFTDRHVLVANTYSKSALRVVAEVLSAEDPSIAYFPSFEIITSPAHRSRYYSDDLREVTEEGVDHVMRVFSRHYLDEEAAPASAGMGVQELSAEDLARFREGTEVVCDEEALED